MASSPMHCIACLFLLVLPARVLAVRLNADALESSENHAVDSAEWLGRGNDEHPMRFMLDWLDKGTEMAMERNVTANGVNLRLKCTKDAKGGAGFLVYSLTADEKPPSKCMDLQFIPETPYKPSEINAAWIGTMGRDFKAGNPCLLDFAYMSGWLEMVFRWNAQHQNYALWTITDAAAGRCKYKSAAGDVSMWEGTQVLLTPLSLFKYGMPFYTKKGGLFPKSVLQKEPAAHREFCAKTLDAKEMGETPLDVLIDELMPVAAGKLKSVASRMRSGKGAGEGATLKDLLQDKSVWTDVQPQEDNCAETTSLMKLMKHWRCRDFKAAGDKGKADVCKNHKNTVRYVTQLGNLYGRYLLNETKNSELICDWYDTTWKAKFWWRPKFWEFWASFKRVLASIF